MGQNMIGYLRVSKADRTREERLGITAQRAAITRTAEQRGWTITDWCMDNGISGKTMRRPGLQSALAQLKAGEADGLVAAKLDRLSRSVIDFGGLLEQSRREGWAIAVLDFDLDTSNATGRLIAGMVVQIAQFEREIIGDRTRAALAVKRAEGAQLGKPSLIPADVQARIVQRHLAGDSLSAIARLLNTDETPTPSGAGRWSHTVVGGVVKRWTATEAAA
jgi:DNA invertase Pin-like site-specific DNA recombinase